MRMLTSPRHGSGYAKEGTFLKILFYSSMSSPSAHTCGSIRERTTRLLIVRQTVSTTGSKCNRGEPAKTLTLAGKGATPVAILIKFQKTREDETQVEYLFGYPEEMDRTLLIDKASRQGS